MRGARSPLAVLAVLAVLTIAALARAAAAGAGEPAPLAPRHTEFLATAGVLLDEAERDAFLSLARDHRRDAFVARFWEVRDPFPDTARNEARERFEERLAAARARFDDLSDPGARALLLDGDGEAPGASGPLPRPRGDWLPAFLERGTELPPGAELLPATLELAYPGPRGGLVEVAARVELPPSAATPAAGAGSPAYALLLDGEVLSGAGLLEEFRYRFEPPAGEPAPERLAVTFTRHLRPGRYTWIVRLQDLYGHRFFREEREIEVPRLAPAAAAPSPGGPVAAAGDGAEEAGLVLLAPRDRLLSGKVRIEARVRGSGVAAVAFSLDGREVMTKGRPPYSVELDLGSGLRPRRVRAVARGASGDELAADEAVLNGGPHRFAVRLREPRAGGTYRGTVRVEAEVEVPDGEELDRVELYLDERRLATLYQPPFVHALALPETGELTFVRAVARLANGLADEDVAVINAPAQLDSIDVDLVELFVTVTDRLGRPVDDLAAGDFTVVEEGRPQRIVRFERLRDLPFHAALLLDTSGSMREVLPEVERAAYAFLSEVITPHDRAAVIPFADEPRVAARFTGSLEVLAGALGGLAADGETKLWDALGFALHYTSGLGGKRALVVLTDGLDSGSRRRFDDLLAYARGSGVALYFVGLGLPAKPPDVRWRLEELARETGGRLFLAARARELGPAYGQLREELSSQYLLAFQARIEGDRSRFRPVAVEVSRPGATVRAPAGYAPRP
ncbi:MAG: VWA domain-containing protein [Thermoanaerobaculia bacterium]|nr:VWA domain-containing protein [Thermoanaerobaculia bacterium]